VRNRNPGSVPATQSFVVGGVRVDAVQLDDAVEAVLTRRDNRTVHLCNAYTVSLASKDSMLAAVLNRGSLNLCDGMPLVWLARRRGFKHMKDRACGPDLMQACLDRGRGVGTKHYLYGSTPEVLDRLRSEIERCWPGVEVVGSESPAFGEFTPLDREQAVCRFTAAGADVVWVGLGTPKQDVEVERLAELGGPCFVAVGAAFDFIAGNKTRPPLWVRRSGLEWLHRLVAEPRRLGKRYLFGNARFLWVVMRGI
jgi:N-acetylglucosaminyldiphosphoundecaprenol N-acetyl-beta-D-mannosaminyltransferase